MGTEGTFEIVNIVVASHCFDMRALFFHMHVSQIHRRNLFKAALLCLFEMSFYFPIFYFLKVVFCDSQFKIILFLVSYLDLVQPFS